MGPWDNGIVGSSGVDRLGAHNHLRQSKGIEYM